MFSHFWSKNKTTVENLLNLLKNSRFLPKMAAVLFKSFRCGKTFGGRLKFPTIGDKCSSWKQETTACIFWHNVHILFQFERSSVKLWKSPETNQLLFLIWTKDSLFFTSNGWTEQPWGWTKIPSWLWLKEHMVLANLNWVSKWF